MKCSRISLIQKEERNLFLLDLALKSPDKGANHILVHENVSHANGEKERALAASIAAPSISNFDIVSEGLWRGAAPSNQAMQKLAEESRIKTIVDLRLAGLGAEEEASRAKKLGIKYIHIPLGFMGPSLCKVAQFLKYVSGSPNQPVFVHCRLWR